MIFVYNDTKGAKRTERSEDVKVVKQRSNPHPLLTQVLQKQEER